MIKVYIWLIVCSSWSTFSFAFDGLESCQDACSSGSCCQVTLDKFKCCGFVNGVCCSGGATCCPQGSQCTSDGLTCEYHTGHVAARMLLESNQQQPPAPLQPDDQNNNVICLDRISVCEESSTCCPMGNQTWGCCNMPNAVCCGDSLHCCPQHTTCNRAQGSCDPIAVGLPTSVNEPTAPLWPQLTHPRASVSAIDIAAFDIFPRMSYDGVQCSDSLECALQSTCCRNTTGQFACCPLPEAVCCSDGEHCCPVGYRCDLSSQRCVKNLPAQPKADVVCPDDSFRCNSTSTCCALPNEEWACCPFEKAVCCPDMLHCCPENTTCDVEHGHCLRTVPANRHSLDSTQPDSNPQTCSNGLISCPGGTCCKNVFGMVACCPHPEATCCNSGNCCPKGTRCDDSTNDCLPLDTTSSSTFHEVSAPQSKSLPGKSTDTVCSDGKTSCPDRETCCRLVDNSFGCCPLANGTCCADHRHCCPEGSICSEDNTCVRVLGQPSYKPAIKARRMTSVVKNSPYNPPRWTEYLGLKDPASLQFCGLCGRDRPCCPDATGQPNRKCCPSPGRICCPDGEHCCPTRTTCVSGGLCAPYDHNLEYSSAVLLGPSKMTNQERAPFLDHHLLKSESWPALMAPRARIDVLYLIRAYYRRYSDQYSVCPDRMRYCELDQKCCPSSQHTYVCVPKDATCCYPSLDTWCPAGWYCSDGRSCKAQPGSD